MLSDIVAVLLTRSELDAQSIDFGFGKTLFLFEPRLQFTRSVLRIDVGFPISASPLPANVGPVSFYVTFGQALSLPAPSPPGASLPQ